MSKKASKVAAAASDVDMGATTTDSDTEYSGHSSSIEGVLPDGKKFDVPATISVVRSLFIPRCYKSPFMLVWIFTCIATLATLALYSAGAVPTTFFTYQFVFWRLGYNVGIGYILHSQSNTQAFQNLCRKYVLRSSLGKAIVEPSVTFRDPKVPAFKLKDYPEAFSAWMVFRFVVNVILANDLLAYLVLVWVHWVPRDVTSVGTLWGVFMAGIQDANVLDIVQYSIGVGLILFALWSKSDAHRVIGDYAWYWGDFFFLLDQKLTFDGIFEMFPHPMYTVGYAFMYGLSLLSQSHTVFYWSVFGHLCQIIFLTWVENPHIDKTYKQKYTAQELDAAARQEAVLYDGETGYFDKKELVVLRNFRLYRASDIVVVLFLAYCTAVAWISAVSDWPALLVVQYAVWRLLHTFGIGWALREQSLTGRWTKAMGGSRKAFDSWKVIYNTVVTTTNYSYLLCALVLGWKNLSALWSLEDEWRLTVALVGGLLMGVNVWSMLSVYESIGDYGYYYGDFFIEDCPRRLEYSGVYRYLNNPDTVLGCAWYYGLALITYEPMVGVLAVATHVLIKLFEIAVEAPHMRRRYGAEVRRDAGVKQAFKDRTRQMKNAVLERQRRARVEYERSLAHLKAEMERRKAVYEDVTARAATQKGGGRKGGKPKTA